MNPLKGLGIIIMWIYDIVMLPFVLLWHIGKMLMFIAFVIIISLLAWGIFFT